jgi:predicted amidophosphoribosyltransferase
VFVAVGFAQVRALCGDDGRERRTNCRGCGARTAVDARRCDRCVERSKRADENA